MGPQANRAPNPDPTNSTSNSRVSGLAVQKLFFLPVGVCCEETPEIVMQRLLFNSCLEQQGF